MVTRLRAEPAQTRRRYSGKRKSPKAPRKEIERGAMAWLLAGRLRTSKTSTARPPRAIQKLARKMTS